MSEKSDPTKGLRIYRNSFAGVVAVLLVVCSILLWKAGSSESVDAIGDNRDVDSTSTSFQTVDRAPQDPETDPLFVLDGARDVKIDEEGAYGSRYLSYLLTAEFPASETIEAVSERLESLGWEPLEEDWLNPGSPSSHVDGWGEFGDATTRPHRHVHQWMGQWRDESGSIVEYIFNYSYPDMGTPDLMTLQVYGLWYPTEGAEIMTRFANSLDPPEAE